MEGKRLRKLGYVYLVLGQIEEAIGLSEKALLIARDTGARWEEGSNVGSLGLAYRELGQTDRSIVLLEDALGIMREVGDRRSEVILLGNLGVVDHALGRFNEARVRHTKALTIARQLGPPIGISYQLLRLGRTLLAQGELATAQGCFEEAWAFGLSENSYQAALMLGIVLLRQRDPAAESRFVDACACCRTLLDQTAGLYQARYALSAAMVGQAVCASDWAEESSRARLLAPALTEYRRALENCAAPGVVRDALRDLESIRSAGIEGLEPVFELLQAHMGEEVSVT